MNQPPTLAQLIDDGNDESELLARYQQGDEDAFAAIYFRHIDDLRAYGGRLLGRAGISETDDVIQETMVHFVANRQRYASARRLLFKILSDVCMDHHRHMKRAKRDHRRTRRLVPTLDPQYARQQKRLEAKIETDKMLRAIPSPHAEAIRLTKLNGHTIAEAAAILGITVKACSHRISRGMATMKKLKNQ